MITIRDDDVICPSSAYSNPLSKFKQVHEWIVDAPGFIHVPTIMVTEIQKFPDAMEYIRFETKAGRMNPQIHCKDHIDYKKLTKSEIIDNLSYCKDFMHRNFDVVATQFFTPWGANAPHIIEASNECGLELIDCQNLNVLDGDNGVVACLKRGEPLSNWDGKQLFWHWWIAGSRLARVCAVAKYGSWELAVKSDPRLFRE